MENWKECEMQTLNQIVCMAGYKQT